MMQSIILCDHVAEREGKFYGQTGRTDRPSERSWSMYMSRQYKEDKDAVVINLAFPIPSELDQ